MNEAEKSSIIERTVITVDDETSDLHASLAPDQHRGDAESNSTSLTPQDPAGAADLDSGQRRRSDHGGASRVAALESGRAFANEVCKAAVTAFPPDWTPATDDELKAYRSGAVIAAREIRSWFCSMLSEDDAATMEAEESAAHATDEGGSQRSGGRNAEIQTPAESDDGN